MLIFRNMFVTKTAFDSSRILAVKLLVKLVTTYETRSRITLHSHNQFSTLLPFRESVLITVFFFCEKPSTSAPQPGNNVILAKFSPSVENIYLCRFMMTLCVLHCKVVIRPPAVDLRYDGRIIELHRYYY